jgi:L-threonylcarbamoyladenylate synthase
MNLIIDKKFFHALELFRQGYAVAFPTETVYGLGADARNSDAVRKILFLKNRPDDKGINVLCNSIEMIEQIGKLRYNLERKLIAHYMPGPLTLIIDSRGSVADKVARGDGTVWVRIPDCKITLDLISSFGYGLATTSANKSGGVSPHSAEEVVSIFWPDVYCVDGWKCTIGIESTIVRVVDEDTMQILRVWALSSKIFVKELWISIV